MVVDKNRPAVILSKPSLSQNIGACARAMLNFGFTDMRLIDPQADWLSKDARALSADADPILENAKVYKTAEEAFFDLQHVYATTARPRDMIKDVVTPKELVPEVVAHQNAGHKVGLLFGSEKCGLENEEIALCDKIVTIPLNPDFSSINLAQATILVCYEVCQGILAAEQQEAKKALGDQWERDDAPARREELTGFFVHLEDELDQKGYFRVDHKRPLMQQNLRNMFSRGNLTSQEVRTLRGVISSLVSNFKKQN